MRAGFNPHRSAALPVTSGTTAPPTMATQMTPDPSAARLPRPSLARVKIVGNMMELNSPRASSDQPETLPTVFAETVKSMMTLAAAQANTLPGANSRSSQAPTNRPTMAPPQYKD